VKAAENGLEAAVDLERVRMVASQTRATLFSGWGDSLGAVVAGNLVYFLLMPFLPAPLQHELFRMDPGLFVDFMFCAVALFVIRRVRRGEKKLS
jgi:hypothetical protein